MIAIVGPAGTGKTTLLRARIAALRAQRPDVDAFVADHPRQLARLAIALLDDAETAFRIVDDIEAEELLARCADGLLHLEWDEIRSGAIDPEVPGLRAPRRFIESAMRLIRKLRDAAVSPEEFLERSLAGAAQFYAHPPNFAHPELLLATKEQYRSSLDVTPQELERQYRREIDLAKILARLYREYLARSVALRTVTARDAVALGIELARAQPERAAALRARYPYVFVDDAQEGTVAARAFLEAVYGPDLEGVTLAGDPKGATSTFDGARPDLAFAGAQERIECTQAYRPVTPITHLHRAKSEADEALFLANEVRARLDAGAAPASIALIFRSVRDVHRYEEALLDRDVPAAVTGDVNIFRDRRALDALALLWNLWDPFEHEYVLRTLSGPAMALSDAALATLCSEPPDAQTPLFAVETQDQPPKATRGGRFDPKRDLRLGWNLTRGTMDGLLDGTARERVRAFRAIRLQWIESLHTQGLRPTILRVWNDALAHDGAHNGARHRAQMLLLERLLTRLCDFAGAHPGAGLGDVLAYARDRAESDLETCEREAGPAFVQLWSVDASRGREFDTVIVADVRAGSFPRWYVPDAFLFSPKLGMIPKDNVGEARASRTAKFSYYLHKSNVRDAYNAQERRAFHYAMQRTTREVVVSASGRATRGTTAPEFLAELQSR